MNTKGTDLYQAILVMTEKNMESNLLRKIQLKKWNIWFNYSVPLMTF